MSSQPDPPSRRNPSARIVSDGNASPPWLTKIAGPVDSSSSGVVARDFDAAQRPAGFSLDWR